MLDFNNLTNEQYLELDKVRTFIKNDYENLLRNIYKKNIDCKEILFSNIISRNNEENNLFYDLCLMELAKILSKKKKISKIITKNKSQAIILKKKLKNINITYNQKYNYFFFKNIFFFIKNFVYLIKIYLHGSKIRKDKFKNNKNAILIETFFISNMFRKKNYEDRYYGKLINYVNKKNKKNLFFFPIFFFSTINKTNIQKAEKKINLITLGDFLKINDYFYSLFFFLKFKKIRLNKIFFRGYNIETLLYEELNQKKLNVSSLIGVLSFLFFKRIKQEKINLKLLIDWYENQIVDKGLNYGKNTFYPNVKSKGYLGLNQIFEVNDSFLPTDLEYRSKISPDEINIISKKYYQDLKIKRKDIKLSIAPSFRNENIFLNTKFKPKKNKNNKIRILINFTASTYDNLIMINLINKCKTIFSNKFEILIRPHQSSKKEIFIQNLSKQLNYKFSNKNIYEEFKNINILISRSSTACFEALVFNVPVIITRRIFNFFPYKNYDKIRKELWFFCNDENEIELSIKKIVNNIKKKKYSSNYNSYLAKNYFLKPNKKNVNKFVN